MDIDKIIKVKSTNKPKPKSERLADSAMEPGLEQPEQLAPIEQLESLAEPIRSESLCGSGWSLAELLDEFGGR